MQFDRQKFKDLVHYVCSICTPDELGAVKLHKVLYYSDMLFYVSNHRPLTGETYVKQKFGPTAKHLMPMVHELKNEGRLDFVKRDFHGYIKTDYISRKPAQTDRLAASEREFVDAVIRFVCKGYTASAISELSHQGVWELAEMGEELPYFTALRLLPAEITAEDLEWADTEATRVVREGNQTASV